MNGNGFDDKTVNWVRYGGRPMEGMSANSRDATRRSQNRLPALPLDEGNLDFTPLSNEELAHLADELFQMSDAEEAQTEGRSQ